MRAIKRFIRTTFYIVLSILGLSYFSLLLFIGAQVARGQVAPSQLVNVLRVIDGQRMFSMPSKDFDEYREFVKDKDALRARMREEYGPPDARAPGAQVLAGERQLLEESLAVARSELRQAKDDVLGAQREVKRLQDLLTSERALFANDVAREAAVRESEMRRRFAALVPSFDAAAMGEMIDRMPADEAARWVREYMPADFAAEALGELPLESRLRIVPLVENPNAGLDPQAAARLFSQRRAIEGTYAMGPREIYQRLRQMNAAQAMATASYLPEELRREVEAFIRNPPP